MKIIIKEDQRGMLHWHAFLVLGLLIAVSVVAFQRIDSVKHVNLAGGTTVVGKVGSAKNVQDKETLSDDEADSNRCFSALQSKFSSDSTETLRTRMLSRISHRQTKTSSYVSSSEVTKLPKDFQNRVVNRLGNPNQNTPGSVQGDLNVTANYLKNTNDNTALMQRTCDTIVATRVYIFWPNYINALAKADSVRKNSDKLSVGVQKSATAFNKSDRQGNNDLSNQLQNLRDSRDKISAGQHSLVNDLLTLEPNSINGSSSTKKLFGDYSTRIKQLTAQQKELAININSFAKNLKKAPPSQRTIYKEYARAIMQSDRLSDQDGRYIAQIRAIANDDFSCNVNPTILRMLYGVVVKDHHRVQMSSLNRRCTGVLTESGTSSYHYRDGGGHAIDVIRFDGMPVVGSGEGSVKYLSAASKYLPKNSGYGQVDSCNANFKIPHGSYAVPDTCNHTHIQVPVRQIKK